MLFTFLSTLYSEIKGSHAGEKWKTSQIQNFYNAPSNLAYANQRSCNSEYSDQNWSKYVPICLKSWQLHQTNIIFFSVLIFITFQTLNIFSNKWFNQERLNTVLSFYSYSGPFRTDSIVERERRYSDIQKRKT